MKKPKVGIVLVNFNGYQDTLECLESLKKIRYKNVEIVVVDNGSSDGSQKYLRHKGFKLIELSENTGYTGGNNVGISYLLHQHCDYVLLLNNDTTVQVDFLDELVEVAVQSELIGTVGPKIYYSDKNQLVSEGGKIDLENGPFLNINQNKSDKHEFTESVERDYLSGCCLLIKKQIFESVGYLDDKYFCYVEDVDFGFRVKLEGYKNVYVPQSVIFHKTSKSSGGEINSFKEFYKSRNFVLFARKHYTNLNIWKFMKSALKNRMHDSKMAILNKNFAIPVSVVWGTIRGLINV